MQIQLKVWRQESQGKKGKLVGYSLPSVTPDMSFLEMLDMLNERLLRMVDQTDKEGFGHCSNTEACQVECPQQISV